MNPQGTHNPTRLSEDFKNILAQSGGQPITLQKIAKILQGGRGLNILVLLFALPFCVPIPLLGFSIPFGIALIILGLRISLRKDPWLPKQLLQREISYSTLNKMIGVALKIMSQLEKVLHPRLQFLNRWATFTTFSGLLITSCAFLLMLPIPIPFTNTLPAISIALIAAGMLDENGAIILTGYLMAGISYSYIFFLGFLGNSGLDLFRFI
ncbi:MAG: exopolysaccharide biosynthesis protein [Nitrospirae bacterium]|nr:exopolysaccharide biosynthesis protein [Nitrospirota bacterium]